MDIDVIVAASSATPAFKADVRALTQQHQTPRIGTARRAPLVKLQRVLAQLLSEEPHLVVDSVRIDAHSGCSDYAGHVDVATPEGTRRFLFTWCCRWRAETEGWTDYFGFPDQIRAANEFGWRCFQLWRETDVEPAVQSPASSATSGRLA